ncbi:YgaP family membrane protein [Flavobacterium lacustre]|jgi:hypothetical protein|uniref:YgaP family membrane protein n=1 Tax=Flavobacterium lacustre TaxID=3016339 RepID=UPI0022B709A8|nr:DUF2892 domain-containing protein [Flavobacterium lacustre]
MKKNVGSTDQIIRLILAILVGILYYTDTISGTLGLVLVALSIVLVLTSVVNFCPLYLPFGINTRKKQVKHK